MAVTVTRNMINSLSSSISGGTVPSGMIIRDVPDFIPFVRRSDTPMLGLVKKGSARDMLKWEYGEGDLSPREDVAAEALDNSETEIDVTNGAYFQKWDLIKIDDEIMLVTSFTNGQPNKINVTRGWGSTSPATHSDGATIKILGPAVPEGVDAPDSPVTRGELFHTFPQIYEYTWQNTHRSRVTPNYEIKSDQFKEELKRKMKEAGEDLDTLLLDGVKNEGDGTGSNPSTMGGLREATTANVTDMNGAPLELQDLLEEMQDVAYDVGTGEMGKVLMGNHLVKRIFNSWFQPTRRTGKSDKSLSLVWDEVETDFGNIKFVINYKMPDNELFLWKPEDARYHPYKGGDWSNGLYSTQGWYDRGFLRGDFGAIFQGDRRRLRIHDFSTTLTDYPNIDIAA